MGTSQLYFLIILECSGYSCENNERENWEIGKARTWGSRVEVDGGVSRGTEPRWGVSTVFELHAFSFVSHFISGGSGITMWFGVVVFSSMFERTMARWLVKSWIQCQRSHLRWTIREPDSQCPMLKKQDLRSIHFKNLAGRFYPRDTSKTHWAKGLSLSLRIIFITWLEIANSISLNNPTFLTVDSAGFVDFAVAAEPSRLRIWHFHLLPIPARISLYKPRIRLPVHGFLS